jgi:hypothetical protein
MRKPLEIASIFCRARPRLIHLVPLLEVSNLISKYKKDSSRYSTIRKYAETAIEGSSKIFLGDISSLFTLDYELNAGTYGITEHGVIKLEKRLNTVYSDGNDFTVLSSNLEAVNIPPITELEPEIEKTKVEATIAMSISEKVGRAVGANVRYCPIEFLSPYQPSFSPSFQE